MALTRDSGLLPSSLATIAVLGLIGGGFSRVGAQESARRDQGGEVTYDLSQPMRVSLNLYDGQGQIVRSLLCGVREALDAQ